MRDRNVEKGKSESMIRIQKRYKRAAEELKERIKAKAATLKRYNNRVNQYRENRLFQSNQSKFYQELDGKSHEDNTIPDKKKN